MSYADGQISGDAKEFIHLNSVTFSFSGWIAAHLESLSGGNRLSYGAIDGTPDLSGFATTAALAGYVTTGSLTATLGSYVTDDALAIALSGYVANFDFDWAYLNGKPSSFTPSAHAEDHSDGGSDPIEISTSQVIDLVDILDGKQDNLQTFVAITTEASAVTLDASNRSTPADPRIIRYTGASNINVSIATSMPVGTSWIFEQAGAGVMTLVTTGGIILNGTKIKTAGQNTFMFAVVVATNTVSMDGGVA